MKILSAILLSAAIILASTTVFANPKQSGVVPEQEHLQMLYPTVLVRLTNGSGSGTVIHSAQNEELEYESYVLTNWHVIQNYVKLNKVWNSEKKEHVETENRRPVNIDLWEYNNFSIAVGTIGRIANIVAYDKSRDLALLQVEDTERQMPHVAKLYPEDKEKIITISKE